MIRDFSNLLNWDSILPLDRLTVSRDLIQEGSPWPERRKPAVTGTPGKGDWREPECGSRRILIKNRPCSMMRKPLQPAGRALHWYSGLPHASIEPGQTILDFGIGTGLSRQGIPCTEG